MFIRTASKAVVGAIHVGRIEMQSVDQLKATIVRDSPIIQTARVMQISGIFDVPPCEHSAERWEVSLPLDFEWNIGLIIGPSGCGKTTIARELFGTSVCSGFEWPDDKSLLDGFPPEMGIKDITEILSSVGFSSPPLWLRPFRVLSTGQQMRVNVARLLSENNDLAVMDEFTSVVDRTVAQIGSAAIAKTVRRRGQKFIAVTCHYDVEEWLQPDWVYQPHTNEFLRRCLQCRPKIELEVSRVHHSCWGLFQPYHYLNQSFNKSARCFVAFLKGEPVALQAVLPSPHPIAKNVYRGHRAVCLPDYQGVGIGNALITHVASAYHGIGRRTLITTASPTLIIRWSRDAKWQCIRKPHLAASRGKTTGKAMRAWIPAINRLTSTWEYIGPAMDEQTARNLIYE
jgi:GNAT superfamily N-acetyltransferase